ncbi:MAG: hypothetical protein COB93_09820 [Sneathiella sp.]|nr:MAG: hypothetical protein COB93_09820 [Sneathiella sp.]
MQAARVRKYSGGGSSVGLDQAIQHRSEEGFTGPGDAAADQSTMMTRSKITGRLLTGNAGIML